MNNWIYGVPAIPGDYMTLDYFGTERWMEWTGQYWRKGSAIPWFQPMAFSLRERSK